MVISCINTKGGVGKSTLAGNLVGWLGKSGYSVILVDCDSQRSSSGWIAEASPGTRIVRYSNADAVLDELPDLIGQADYVVADGPGSQTEVNRALMLWTDLAIVPCKASMFEARALHTNTSFIRQAQHIRNGRPEAVAVLSMVSSRFRLTRDMREAALALGLTVAHSVLSLRQSLADAPGQGTFVWQMGRSARPSADEIDELFHEIIPEPRHTLSGATSRHQPNGYDSTNLEEETP